MPPRKKSKKKAKMPPLKRKSKRRRKDYSSSSASSSSEYTSSISSSDSESSKEESTELWHMTKASKVNAWCLPKTLSKSFSQELQQHYTEEEIRNDILTHQSPKTLLQREVWTTLWRHTWQKQKIIMPQ